MSRTLYDQDFYLWTQREAGLLRSGDAKEADLAHIAEELEDLGRRDRHGMESRVRVLLMHLLKWMHQPERREGSTWLSTIISQRRELELLLRDSPSLRHLLECDTTLYEEAYRKARKDASRETTLPLSNFRECRPFTVDQILDEDFLP